MTPVSDPQVASRQTASTLLRGLSVLERVAAADADGVGVTELGMRAGLDKSTASRVLATLREAGYVRQDTRRRYHLTAKLSRLAAGYSASADVVTHARRVLAGLHEEFDEEIHLAVVNGGEMVFVDYVPSSQPVRSNLPTAPAPVHRLAVGHAVLALLPHEERADVLTESFRQAGERLTMPRRKELAAGIERARARGWADYDAGDDITRIAAAFTDAVGRPMGALCLSGPSYRMDPKVSSAAGRVVAAAAAISAGLAAVTETGTAASGPTRMPVKL